MKRYLKRAWVAVILTMVMVVTQFGGTGIEGLAASSTEKQAYSCALWILKEDQERPDTLEELDSKVWKFKWGDYATISKKVETCNDETKFEDITVQLSDTVQKMLKDGQEVRWFSAKQTGYRWNVYGEICDIEEETPEPTATPYMHSCALWILKEGQERPENFEEIDKKYWAFNWGDYAQVSKKVACCNDETVFEDIYVNLSKTAENMLEDGQEIRWFSARQKGYRWELYGEISDVADSDNVYDGDIIEEETPKPTATPYMHSCALWILKEGQERPENFEEIDKKYWAFNWGDYAQVSKKVTCCNDETVFENISVNLSKTAENMLKDGQKIRWFSARQKGYRWELYGEISDEVDNDCPTIDLEGSCANDEVTVTPAVTATPVVTATPEVTVTPVVTATPEITATPVVTATPEITATPVVTVTPKVTVAPTATIDVSSCCWTGFMILGLGQERPKSLDELDDYNWQWGNFGYIKWGGEVYDQDAVESRIVTVPADTTKLLKEDEGIHWFATKRVGYGWRVYGEIYNVNVENSRNNGAVESNASEVTVDTVADIAKLNDIYNNGTIIRTRGYYSNDGKGAASYVVADRSTGGKYTSFVTGTGQHVNMIVEGGMINMLQLGAGHCKENQNNSTSVTYNDDADRFSEALGMIDKYEDGIIYFPEGEYRCASKVNLGGSRYTVKGDGNKTILYTDNGYKGDEHFLTITGSDITLDNLRVEARETRKVAYYRQCSVMFATNIEITNCEFSVQDNVISDDGNTDRQYTNITLYTGWHNVIIDNCLMEQMACVERGACLGIIDMWSNGCSGVSVTNCTMRQNAHDEMLGIFTKTGATAAISDVYIANNDMYTASASNVSKKTMAITVAYDDSKAISNVRIVNNKIRAEVPSNFMTFGVLKDCVVEENEFDIVHTSNSNSGVLFDARTGVSIKNNTINISSQTGYGVGGIFKRDGVFENNTVNSKCYVIYATCNGGTAIDNTFNLQKGCSALAADPKYLERNSYQVASYMKNMFYYMCLSYDSKIIDNKVSYSYDDTNREETKNVLSGYMLYMGFHAGMNNYSVVCKGNVIDAPNVTAKNKGLLCYGVGENSDAKEVKIEDNQVGVYKWVRSLYGQSLSPVTLADNYDKDGNIVDKTDYTVWHFAEVE